MHRLFLKSTNKVYGDNPNKFKFMKKKDKLNKKDENYKGIDENFLDNATS